METQQTIGGALRGIISSVIFQLATRVVTFISNVIVVRSVSEEVTGFFHVHLQLMMDVVFFISREIVRRTIMRKLSDNLNKAISLSMLRIVIGVGIEIILLPFLYFRAPDIQYAFTSYFIYSIGLAITLFEEPYLMNMILTQQYNQRFFFEVPIVLIGTILQSGLIHFFPEYALLIYPTVYTITTSFVILSYKIFVPLPPFDKEVLSLNSLKEYKEEFKLYTRQTLQKLLLQEGERTVLVLTTTLSIQGIFSVISNISSLIVRFLFLPIEEVCYSLFSKMRNNKEEAIQAFCSFFKILIYIALLVLCFGPPYSKAFLDFLYNNEEYTKNSHLLIIAFLSIATIAINGVSEAFFHATATEKQLKQSNNFMFIFSIVYVTLCIILTKFIGTSGLFFANILNMMLRIVYSHWNIYQQFGKLPWKNIIPNGITLISLICLFGINYVVALNLQMKSFICLCVGGCLGICELAIIYLCDKEFVVSLKNFFMEKRSLKNK